MAALIIIAAVTSSGLVMVSALAWRWRRIVLIVQETRELRSERIAMLEGIERDAKRVVTVQTEIIDALKQENELKEQRIEICERTIETCERANVALERQIQLLDERIGLLNQKIELLSRVDGPPYAA